MNKMIYILFIPLLWISVTLNSQSVTSTKHNLYLAGLSATRSISSAQSLCEFCDTRNEYNSELGDQVNKIVNYKHVVEEQTPCNACHDPHGISNMQGTLANNSHLINFDKSIVQPRVTGEMNFQDNGYRSGLCNLKCHGVDHDAETY